MPARIAMRRRWSMVTVVQYAPKGGEEESE
jgi:hypothetical protein